MGLLDSIKANYEYGRELMKIEMGSVKNNVEHGVIKAKRAVGDMKVENPIKSSYIPKQRGSGEVIGRKIYFRIIDFQDKTNGFTARYLVFYNNDNYIIPVPSLNPKQYQEMIKTQKGFIQEVWSRDNPRNRFDKTGVELPIIHPRKTASRLVKFQGREINLEKLDYQTVDLLLVNKAVKPLD